MNFSQWLNEMPIANWQLQGKWAPNDKRYKYSNKDIGILTNPKAVAKIHRKWKNTQNEWDLYFIRDFAASQHLEVGEVTQEWVQENLGLNIQPREDAITILFTQNVGTEKIPMTAWIIAHRIGHAIRRQDIFQRHFADEIERDFKELLREIYGFKKSYSAEDNAHEAKMLRALAHALGTMKSAQNRKLLNFGEFAHEIVAQYIITGTVKFNPVPKSLITQMRFAWGNPVHDTRRAMIDGDDEEHWRHWNDYVESHAEKYAYYLQTVFNSIEGKMFVM